MKARDVVNYVVIGPFARAGQAAAARGSQTPGCVHSVATFLLLLQAIHCAKGSICYQLPAKEPTVGFTRVLLADLRSETFSSKALPPRDYQSPGRADSLPGTLKASAEKPLVTSLE